MDPRATELWNRASILGVDLVQAKAGGIPVGLYHLACLLRFHNAVMSGGLAFAIEITSNDQLKAVLSASRYFAIAELARFLEQVMAADRNYELIEQLGPKYVQVTEEDRPGPGVIDRAFEERLKASPGDFEDGNTSP